MTFAHVGENGQPCPHHEPATLDTILMLATVGSRVSGFNHDIASKLQGLMMALDEISEVIEGRNEPILTRAAETAHASLKEANQLLQANRALTRSSSRSTTTLRAVMAGAAARSGTVLRGEIPETPLEAAAAILEHGIGLAFDAVGGPGNKRTLEVVAIVDGGKVTLTVSTASPPPRNAPELLALATFVVRREGGELFCAADGRLVVRFGG